MTTPKKTVALIIDGDNAQFQYLKHIIRFCEVFGTLSIKQAYGDWKKLPLSAHRQTMTELGVKPVQQDRVAKNATDMKLAMEVNSMLDRGEANIYFLVSRDGDFTAVCQQIRQKGARVIGIGSENHASSELQKACTLFIDVDEIVKYQSEVPTKPAVVPKTKAKKLEATLKKQSNPSTKTVVTAQSKKIILEMLVEACKNTSQEEGWAEIGRLKDVLLSQRDKEFKKHSDGKKISTWLKHFPHKFEIKDGRVRMK